MARLEVLVPALQTLTSRHTNTTFMRRYQMLRTSVFFLLFYLILWMTLLGYKVGAIKG